MRLLPKSLLVKRCRSSSSPPPGLLLGGGLINFFKFMENQNYLGTHELSVIMDRINEKKRNFEKVESIMARSERLKQILAFEYKI